MPLNLEEILALPDIGQKINYLKKGRKTELPDCCKLWDDWNPERHEIMAFSLFIQIIANKSFPVISTEKQILQF